MENAGMQDIADIIAEAVAAEGEGHAQSAETMWDRVTDCLPNDPAAALRTAEELHGEGAIAAAEALLGHMVRIYPEHLIAALRWSEAAFRRRDWQETLRRSALVRQRFTNASFAYVLAAQALRESGNLEAADAAFAEAVERFPTDEGAAIQWADCAFRRSDFVEADRRYSQARDRFPNSSFGYSMGAQVLQADGRISDADQLLTEAVDKFPDEMQLHAAWTASARSREDWAQAISRADISLARFPESIRDILPIVQDLIEVGREEEADGLIDRCADQFPDDPAVLLTWTEVAFKARKWTVAQPRAARLVARLPDDHAGYYFSAASLREDGKAEEAILVLEEGLRRFPQDLLLLREASQSFAVLDRPKEAVVFVDRALALQPDDAFFLHRRIQLALGLDDQDGAMAAWRRLAANLTSDRKLCGDLAWAIFKTVLPGEPALELLLYLVNEPDDGARDRLPRLADFAALSRARPEMKAFAQASLPRLESGACVPLMLHILKSALRIDYTDDEILTFIQDYVAGGRAAVTAYLFSRAYIGEKPLAAGAFRMVFDRYIGRWLDSVSPQKFRDLDAILGYLMFSAIFSQSRYRQLIAEIAVKADLTAVEHDPGARISARVLVRLVSLARRIRPSDAKAEAISRIRRLKIAVCVSGQLRGFPRAVETWQRLGLDRHSARYFVHSWNNVGFELRHLWALTRNHPALSEIFNRPDCATVLAVRYPTMMAAWEGASTVTVEQLHALYGTSSVIVEHDENPVFAGKGGAWKMQRSIECAYGLALASGEEFDLFIRLRPDCEILEGSKPDWNTVFHRSSHERVLYADRPFEYEYSGCTIGDRFAAGCRDVMAIYSATPSSMIEFVGTGEPPLDPADPLDIGGDLAYRTFYGGLLTNTVPELKFGQRDDAGPLTLADLAPLIESDIAGRAADEFDLQFLAACRATAE